MIAVARDKGAVLFWRMMPALLAVCIASGSAPSDPGAFADIQLTVMWGMQVRAIDLVPPKSVGLEDEWPNFIRMQLKLRGRAVRNVSEIGEVILREATDDLGCSMLGAAQDE